MTITQRDVDRIAHSLGKATPSGTGYSCLCPTHDDHTPSLHLSEDHGKLLYKCFSGCPQEIVGKALRQKFPELFKSSSDLRRSEKTSRATSERKKMTKEEMANSLWQSSVVAQDTPVQTYIQHRVSNINPDHIPSCLKYLPQAYHSQEKKKLRCLVAPITIYPADDVNAISRTYLNDKGTDKADVTPQKAILGAVKGGAIVLDRPTEHLGIAEGLESALSVREIVHREMPIWATGTATNLVNLQLPALPLASDITFFCDYDDAGLKAVLNRAEKARKEGRNIKVLRPVPPHTDWNDAYIEAVKNKSQINLESLSEVVNEAEELKRLALNKKDLGKQPEQMSDSDFFGIDDDVAIAKHLLRQLQKQYGEVVYAEGNLWAYPASSTHWRPFHDEYLIRRIQSYSGKGNTKLDGKFEYIELSKSKISSILSNLYSLKKVPPAEDIFFKTTSGVIGVNCLNGFLKIDRDGTFCLIAHDKKYRQRFTVPYPFNPVLLDSLFNESCPLWSNSLLKKLLYGCFKNDPDLDQKISFVMEVLGVAIADYSLQLRQPKAIIFYGDTAENGKSQMLDMMAGLFSPHDICSIDPEYFGDDKRRLTLQNKKLNLVYELSGNAIQSHYAKQIITGDVIDARALYKMPVNFRCAAAHIWATNKLPAFFGGMDRGVQRRLGVLSFNRVIPKKEKIVDIGKKIAETEGELLLAFAVFGAISLIINGDYSFPPSSAEVMEQWKSEADPVLGFIQECLEHSPSSVFITSQSVYDLFLGWAGTSGLKRDKLPALKAFVQRLKNNLPEGIVYKRTKTNRGFVALKIINLSEQTEKVVPFRPYVR